MNEENFTILDSVRYHKTIIGMLDSEYNHLPNQQLKDLNRALREKEEGFLEHLKKDLKNS